MGYLGGYITIHNKTDHTLNICIKLLKPERCCKFKVEPQEIKTNGYWTFSSWASFKVKLGDREQDWCDDPDLWCLFNPRDNPYFTIQESNDRQYIELHCNTNHKKKKSKYPNYGKK